MPLYRIQLTQAGINSGPLYDVYWSLDCVNYFPLTGSSPVNLPSVGSFVNVNVPDNTLCVKLQNNTEICDNEIIKTLLTGSTTTTTTTSTTSTTTTSTTTTSTTTTTTAAPTTTTTTLCECVSGALFEVDTTGLVSWTYCDNTVGSQVMPIGPNATFGGCIKRDTVTGPVSSVIYGECCTPETTTTTTTTTAAPTTTTTTTTTSTTTTTTTTAAPTTTTTSTSTTTTTTEAFVSIFIDNNNSLDVPITDMTINGVSVTYESGQNFTINAGNNGNFSSTQLGTQTVTIFYGAHISGQNIVFTDSDNNITCKDLNGGAGSFTIPSSVITGGTTIYVTVSDGACF